MQLSKHTLLPCIAVAGATLLISASAAVGIYQAINIGLPNGLAVAAMLATAAAGAEILKPLAVSGAIATLGRGDLVRGGACVLLAAVILAYSTTSALNFVAGGRFDVAAQRQAATSAAETAREDRARALKALEAIGSARPAGEVRAALAAAKKADAPALRQELARAEARERLEAEATAAGKRLATLGPAVTADPLAVTLAGYLALAGHAIPPATVALFIPLGLVLLLEVGSALGLVIVRAVSDTPANSLPKPPAAAEPPAGTKATAEAIAAPAPVQGPPAVENPIGSQLLHMLGQAGGVIARSERKLAELLGSSKTSTRRAVQELAEKGLVRVTASPEGTRISLA